MALLSISEAAKLFGKSRTTLYKYNKSGLLSFVSRDDGKPAVDLSEMLRVFGSVQKQSVHGEQNEHMETSISEGEKQAIEGQIAALQEIIRRQDGQLRQAEERERWLQEQLERAQQHVQALIHQPQAQSDTKKPKRKRWWPW